MHYLVRFPYLSHPTPQMVFRFEPPPHRWFLGLSHHPSDGLGLNPHPSRSSCLAFYFPLKILTFETPALRISNDLPWDSYRVSVDIFCTMSILTIDHSNDQAGSQFVVAKFLELTDECSCNYLLHISHMYVYTLYMFSNWEKNLNLLNLKQLGMISYHLETELSVFFN